MLDARRLDPTIRSAIAGNSASLESLLLHFHDPLLQFIQSSAHLGATPDLSPEDILQETFIETFRHIQSLEARGPDAFFAWLKSIARTRLLNMIAARKAQKRGGLHHRVATPASPDATATTILELLAATDTTPSLITRRAEANHLTARAIAALDPDRRHVLDLRFVQGLPLADIAARTGKSEGAVKMLIHRTLQDLRAALAKSFGNSFPGA